MSAGSSPARPADQARPAKLAEALGELRAGVDCAAREVDQLQDLMLDLVRRAGAERDAGVIEDVQRIDPLVQRLHRLAASVEDLTAAVRSGPAADLELDLGAAARRRLAQGAAADHGQEGDFELF